MTLSPPTGELVARLRDVVTWLLTSRLVGHEVRAVAAAEDIKRTADAITTLERELEEAGRQRDFLREIIGLCAAALPNGAFIDATRASESFISHLPSEISSVCHRLSSDKAASQAEVERLRDALSAHERLLLINKVRKAAEEVAPLWLEAADAAAERARQHEGGEG